MGSAITVLIILVVIVVIVALFWLFWLGRDWAYAGGGPSAGLPALTRRTSEKNLG